MAVLLFKSSKSGRISCREENLHNETGMSFCRLDFWDRVNDDYQVDMTPLKDYARECVTRRPYEMTVRPKDVLAGAVQIQHFNIETMETDDLKLVKVWNFYQLKGILFVQK